MTYLLNFYPGDTVTFFVATTMAQVLVITILAHTVARLGFRYESAGRYAIYLCGLCFIGLSPLLTTLAYRLPITTLEIPFSEHSSANDPIAAPALVKQPQESRPGKADSVADATTLQTAARPPEADEIRVLETPGQTQHRNVTVLPKPSVSPMSVADKIRMAVAGFFLIWLAGSSLLIIRLAYGFGVLAMLRSEAVVLSDEWTNACRAHIKQVLGANRVPPLATSTLVGTPVAVGIWKPVVIVPVSMFTALGYRQLSHVLTHEYAHLVRRDPVVGLLQRLVTIAYWPITPIHRFNRELARAREEVCDNYVLQRSKATDYAKTLLRVGSEPGTFLVAPVTLGIISPTWKLEDRIRHMVNVERSFSTRFRGGVFALASTIFALAVIDVGGIDLVLHPADSPHKPASAKVAELSDDEQQMKQTTLVLRQLLDAHVTWSLFLRQLQAAQKENIILNELRITRNVAQTADSHGRQKLFRPASVPTTVQTIDWLTVSAFAIGGPAANGHQLHADAKRFLTDLQAMNSHFEFRESEITRFGVGNYANIARFHVEQPLPSRLAFDPSPETTPQTSPASSDTMRQQIERHYWQTIDTVRKRFVPLDYPMVSTRKGLAAEVRATQLEYQNLLHDQLVVLPKAQLNLGLEHILDFNQQLSVEVCQKEIGVVRTVIPIVSRAGVTRLDDFELLDRHGRHGRGNHIQTSPTTPENIAAQLELNRLEAQLWNSRNRYTDNHPIVIALKNEIRLLNLTVARRNSQTGQSTRIYDATPIKISVTGTLPTILGLLDALRESPHFFILRRVEFGPVDLHEFPHHLLAQVADNQSPATIRHTRELRADIAFDYLHVILPSLKGEG